MSTRTSTAARVFGLTARESAAWVRVLVRDLALGVVVAASATAVRWMLDPLLGDAEPFAVIYIASAGAAWFFGWRCAVVNVVAAQLLASFYFVPPRATMAGVFPDAAVALYYLTAIVIVYAGHRARSSLDALRESALEKDAFIAVLSHELRNPLGAIRNSQSLLEREALSENGRRAMATQERQVRQLIRLTDDLVEANRLAHGRVTLKKEFIDVRTCIADAAASMASLLAPRCQKLVVNVPEEPMPVYADPARIMQMMVNLIGNASKYSVDGSRIVVDASHEPDGVVIAVTDNGVGIERELLPHIFEPFYIGRDHLSGKQGMGIGLWLVKQFAEMHGGTVKAESRGTGEGSRFTLRLPRATPSD